MDNVLEVKNLTAAFRIRKQEYEVLHDISFTVKRNETLCVVGESGCGKSVTTLCVMQLALFAFRVFLGTTSWAGILSVPVQIGLSMLAWPLIYPAAWAVRKAGA